MTKKEKISFTLMMTTYITLMLTPVVMLAAEVDHQKKLWKCTKVIEVMMCPVHTEEWAKTHGKCLPGAYKIQYLDDEGFPCEIDGCESGVRANYCFSVWKEIELK